PQKHGLSHTDAVCFSLIQTVQSCLIRIREEASEPSNVCIHKGGSIVQEAAVSLLTTWQNFYVIIGSSAAALTGLMFVVITLIAGTRQQRSSESVGAFGTPTVVHFGAALLVAAILVHRGR